MSTKLIQDAIDRADALRDVILKAVERENYKADYINSPEYFDKQLNKMQEANESNTATKCLDGIDSLLYDLLEWQRETSTRWHSQDDYESKEVLRLKEIISTDLVSQLKTAS